MLAFKFIGEKWIENKFATQLAEAEHKNNAELQELKKEIDFYSSLTSAD